MSNHNSFFGPTFWGQYIMCNTSATVTIIQLSHKQIMMIDEVIERLRI